MTRNWSPGKSPNPSNATGGSKTGLSVNFPNPSNATGGSKTGLSVNFPNPSNATGGSKTGLSDMFRGSENLKNFIVPEGSWVHGMTEKMGPGNF